MRLITHVTEEFTEFARQVYELKCKAQMSGSQPKYLTLNPLYYSEICQDMGEVCEVLGLQILLNSQIPYRELTLSAEPISENR